MIKSPCILVCSIDQETGFCFGCGRTREEIGGWMSYSVDERDEIMGSLATRLSAVEQKPRRETKRRRMKREKAEAAGTVTQD